MDESPIQIDGFKLHCPIVVCRDQTLCLGKAKKCRVENNRVNLNITPNTAKGTKSRINSTKSSDPLSMDHEEGEDDLTSLTLCLIKGVPT